MSPAVLCTVKPKCLIVNYIFFTYYIVFAHLLCVQQNVFIECRIEIQSFLKSATKNKIASENKTHATHKTFILQVLHDSYRYCSDYLQHFFVVFSAVMEERVRTLNVYKSIICIYCIVPFKDLVTLSHSLNHSVSKCVCTVVFVCAGCNIIIYIHFSICIQTCNEN